MGYWIHFNSVPSIRTQLINAICYKELCPFVLSISSLSLTSSQLVVFQMRWSKYIHQCQVKITLLWLTWQFHYSWQMPQLSFESYVTFCLLMNLVQSFQKELPAMISSSCFVYTRSQNRSFLFSISCNATNHPQYAEPLPQKRHCCFLYTRSSRLYFRLSIIYSFHGKLS